MKIQLMDGICGVCGVSLLNQEPQLLYTLSSGNKVLSKRLCKKHNDKLAASIEIEEKEGLKGTKEYKVEYNNPLVKLRIIAEDSNGKIIREISGEIGLNVFEGYFPAVLEEDLRDLIDDFVRTREIEE